MPWRDALIAGASVRAEGTEVSMPVPYLALRTLRRRPFVARAFNSFKRQGSFLSSMNAEDAG
jgi:hypothetical protein